MSELDRMQAMIRTSSRRETIMTQLTYDPTADYRPASFYAAEMVVNDLPLYTHFTGMLMLKTDPVVRFAHNIRNAAMMQADVKVTAKREDLKQWAKKQWKTLWDHNRTKLTKAKRYGFAVNQVICQRDKQGLLHVAKLKTFRPVDCKAMTRDGDVYAVRIQGVEKPLQAPQVMWMKFDEDEGTHYCNGGLLHRQYPPWYEKWMDSGAKKLGQLRMIKDAYMGDVMEYPSNMVVTMPDGNVIPWRDLLRDVIEKRRSGGGVMIPTLLDDKGQNLVKYTPPQNIAIGEHIWDWEDRCNKDMLRACDVPLEVVEAQENGGFSGRSIPFMVVLSVVQEEFNEIVRTIKEELRLLAWLNWGGDPEFDIEPISLVEAFAKDASGSAMGGSAVGSQQGAAPQQQAPSDVQFANDDHEFSSTQFNMPTAIAECLAAMANRISPDDLAGDGIERESHVTVKYGLHTNDADEVRRAVQSMPPVAIRLGKTSVFPANEKQSQRGGEQYDVLKIEVESKGLHKLNTHLAASLQCTDTFPDYKPHITIAYVKPGMGAVYASRLCDCEGMLATFDRLWFSDKQRQGHSIALTGDAVQFAADETLHAPAGGLTIKGKRYEGGEFIPSAVVDSLSDEDRGRLEMHGTRSGGPPAKEFVIAGMTLKEAVKLAERHGYKDAERLISSRPSGWVDLLGQLKESEATEKKQQRKDVKESNWNPSETQREVLVAIGDSRIFTRAGDLPMMAQNKKATKYLIEKGIIERTDNGREVSYRNLKTALHSQSSKKNDSAQFDLSDDQSIAALASTAAALERLKHTAKNIRKMLRGKDVNDPQWMTDLENALRIGVEGVGVELLPAMHAAGIQGAAEVAAKLPALFRVSDPPPVDLPPLETFVSDDEPMTVFPILENAEDTLRVAPIDVGRTWQETAAKARAGTFAVTADLEQAAVDKLRVALADTIANGGGEDEYFAAVDDLFGGEGPLGENHLRTIFRTNVAASFEDGKERAVNAPGVRDAFPYRRYFATSDQRCRQEHKALGALPSKYGKVGLNSTAVYRADDPVWQEFRPPWEFGCRCSSAPQTVEQAARAGVQEAIDWIARAKEMAGGEDYHTFLSRTAPTQPEHVPHPPFHAPPEFQRDVQFAVEQKPESPKTPRKRASKKKRD